MNIAEDIVMCMPIGIAKSAAQNTTHYPRPQTYCHVDENHMQFASGAGSTGHSSA